MNALVYFSPSMFIFTVHLTVLSFCSNVLVNLFAFDTSMQGTSPNCHSTSQLFVYSVVSSVDIIHILLLAGLLFYSIHFKNTNAYFKRHLYLTSTILGLLMMAVMTSFFVDIVRGFYDE